MASLFLSVKSSSSWKNKIKSREILSAELVNVQETIIRKRHDTEKNYCHVFTQSHNIHITRENIFKKGAQITG